MKTILLEWWDDNEESYFKSCCYPCLYCCGFCCDREMHFWNVLPDDSDIRNGAGLLGGLTEWEEIYPEGCPKRNLSVYLKKVLGCRR
eukprot:UN34614